MIRNNNKYPIIVLIMPLFLTIVVSILINSANLSEISETLPEVIIVLVIRI